jgi:drug/metabolite transporter (DMT)-like permease
LELRNLPQRTQKILRVAGDQCLGITAGILAFKAMGMGPVALVSVVLNARPAFVFIFSLLLGLFFPRFINDRLNKRTFLMKFIAIGIITGGIVIISLSK